MIVKHYAQFRVLRGKLVCGPDGSHRVYRVGTTIPGAPTSQPGVFRPAYVHLQEVEVVDFDFAPEVEIVWHYLGGSGMNEQRITRLAQDAYREAKGADAGDCGHFERKMGELMQRHFPELHTPERPLFRLALHRAVRLKEKAGELSEAQAEQVYGVLLHPVRKDKDGNSANVLEKAHETLVSWAQADPAICAQAQAEQWSWSDIDWAKIWGWFSDHIVQLAQVISSLLIILAFI